MGMDVYGRNPKTETGKYFRANIWSWRPIHQLCADLCSDILEEETLVSMSFNDGAGPEDQETCDKMVNRFEKWMENNIGGAEIPSDILVTEEGRLLLAGETKEEARSVYRISDERLKDWVEFLRNCGGFQVY